MVLQKTYISDVLDEVEAYKVRYDNSVKMLLADPQVLARILKYTVEEFADEEISTIMACMEEAEVSVLEPMGEHCLKKVESGNTEDIDPEGGLIRYDIRFAAHTVRKHVRILINVEAQQSTRLTYRLGNRIAYYMARMVTSQKNVEFSGQDYDGIKRVYSIWICMDAAEGKDSIVEASFGNRNVYGNPGVAPDVDVMRAVIINIRKNRGGKKSRHALIAMLEELLSGDDAKTKKSVLEEEYGMRMSVGMERSEGDMCNLSELVWEDGLEKGLQRGREEGGMAVMVENVRNLMDSLNMTAEQAMDVLRIPLENRRSVMQSI